MAIFWKTEACGQTLLPDRSFLIGQKLVENKIQKLKCDILSNFQTLCICYDDIKLDLIEGQFEGQQVDEQIL